MTIQEKINMLKQRTVANGCTKAEEEVAKKKIKELEAQLRDSSNSNNTNQNNKRYTKQPSLRIFINDKFNSERYDITAIYAESFQIIDKFTGKRSIIDRVTNLDLSKKAQLGRIEVKSYIFHWRYRVGIYELHICHSNHKFHCKCGCKSFLHTYIRNDSYFMLCPECLSEYIINEANIIVRPEFKDTVKRFKAYGMSREYRKIYTKAIRKRKDLTLRQKVKYILKVIFHQV